jgi:hypothetical protein
MGRKQKKHSKIPRVRTKYMSLEYLQNQKVRMYSKQDEMPN